MEDTDQGATTTSQVEENLVVEGGDQFASYDTSFHGHVEGHVDSLVCLNYGPNAPF